MLPLGTEYQAIVEGEIVKRVQCEHCAKEYACRMIRAATGTDTSIPVFDAAGSQRRAAENAREALYNKLRRECEAVPCSNCGWYQSEMVAQLKRQHHHWVFIAGTWLLYGLLMQTGITIVLVFSVGEDVLGRLPVLYWLIAAHLGLGGFALIALQRILGSNCVCS